MIFEFCLDEAKAIPRRGIPRVSKFFAPPAGIRIEADRGGGFERNLAAAWGPDIRQGLLLSCATCRNTFDCPGWWRHCVQLASSQWGAWKKRFEPMKWRGKIIRTASCRVRMARKSCLRIGIDVKKMFSQQFFTWYSEVLYTPCSLMKNSLKLGLHCASQFPSLSILRVFRLATQPIY